MDKKMVNRMETEITKGFAGWMLKTLHDPKYLILENSLPDTSSCRTSVSTVHYLALA